MKPISLRRRIALALFTFAIAAALFRPQVAVALVTRGDTYLQRGEIAAARRYYDRALFFDPHTSLAAERQAFAGLETSDPRIVAHAIAVADRALRDDPANLDLHADRGLLRQRQGRYAEARLDFLAVAAARRDPRFFHFAAWAAYRAHDRAGARRLWTQALAADAGFTPARRALARADLR